MNSRAEKRFTVRRWTKATFWGWLLGVVLILILSSLLDSIGIEHLQFYLGLGMGAGVGFAQWLLLRKFASINKNWIWFSALGMVIPFIISDLMASETVSYKLPLSLGFGALTVGFLQYGTLKKYSQKAYLWILGCFIGWSLAVITVFTIDYTNHLKPLISSNLVLALINLFLILAGGIVLGIISGIALKRIIQ